MSNISHAYPGPDDIHVFRFDNGLRLYVRQNPAAPVAVMEGHLATGAMHDPADLPGLADFVSGMVTRGSARFDYDTFNETVEGVGAAVDVSGDTHVTRISVSGLAEDFPMLVELLADGLRRPTFPPAHVELLRNQTLVYQQEREQDTQRMAALRFYATMYADHVYGRPVSGFPDTVKRITRDDLVEFHATHYGPAEAILVVTGAVDPAAVAGLVETHFGDWQPAPAHAIPARPQPVGTSVTTVHNMPGKFQSDIVLGSPAVARDHPDFYAVRVANTILGRFGMMGRLGERIREEEGLAYYCYSSQDADLLGGVWYAAAGVNPANVSQTTNSVLEEFARLAATPPTAAELTDSQAYLTGILPLTLETNEGVANTILSMVWHDLGLDYLYRYADIINGVGVEDVQRVAHAYLRPACTVLSIAGPQGA